MKMNTIFWRIFLLLFVLCLIHCRDFYMGMFKRNDFLVAQDRLYKEKIPYRRVIAKYGRVFTCPITYFRVVNRLGYGAGPTVQIIRGGLRKRYIVARMASSYNLPISVNIYVGCENKMKTTKRPTTTVAPLHETGSTDSGTDGGNSTDAGGDGSDSTGGDSTGGGNTTDVSPGGDEEETPAPPDE